MRIYHYNRDTKEYICSTEAMLDPLELEINKKEVWMLPANATFEAPPDNEPGTMVVMAETGWQIVDIPVPPEPEVIPEPELTEEQIKESLIQAEMTRIIRGLAITNLKAEGKI
jgi:hypothetical protein